MKARIKIAALLMPFGPVCYGFALLVCWGFFFGVTRPDGSAWEASWFQLGVGIILGVVLGSRYLVKLVDSSLRESRGNPLPSDDYVAGWLLAASVIGALGLVAEAVAGAGGWLAAGGYGVYALIVLFVIPWGGCVDPAEVIAEQQKRDRQAAQEEARRKRAARIARLAEAVGAVIDQHVERLSINRRQMVIRGDYDLEDHSKWDKEKEFFLTKVVATGVLRSLSSEAWVPNDGDAVLRMISTDLDCDRMIESAIERHGIGWQAPLIRYHDEMSGIDYEHYCSAVLAQHGWDSRVTQASGDQGADVIARREDLVVVVQCKKYSSPLGNTPVQEVYTAMGLHRADAAVVVTNSSFTRGAREAADGLQARVLLIHHDELPRLYELLADC